MYFNNLSTILENSLLHQASYKCFIIIFVIYAVADCIIQCACNVDQLIQYCQLFYIKMSHLFYTVLTKFLSLVSIRCWLCILFMDNILTISLFALYSLISLSYSGLSCLLRELTNCQVDTTNQKQIMLRNYTPILKWCCVLTDLNERSPRTTSVRGNYTMTTGVLSNNLINLLMWLCSVV